MFPYGKTIKMLKWIFQKRREDGAAGYNGEIISDESETAPTRTINDLKDMEEHDDDGEEMDKRMVLGKTQQRGIGGHLSELMNKHGASFTVNLKQFKDTGYVPQCFPPDFQNGLFVHRPQEDYLPLLLHQERKKTSTLDNIRRRACKIAGSSKSTPSFSLDDTDDNSKKKEGKKSNINTMKSSRRTKEIVKWQSRPKISESNKRWKILNRNKGSLKGSSSSEEDLFSWSSKLSRCDMKNGSSSSFSSTSGSSSSSSFRGVQSSSSLSNVATRCSKDNWITSDSEYVVLEI